MQKARAWTEWKVWRWSRSVLLTCSAALAVMGVQVSHARGEALPGEGVWVGAMVALVLGLAWLGRPTWWIVAFTSVFVVFEIVTPADHYSAAWLAVYAVCIDANSRRPAWFGPAITGLLVVPGIVSSASLQVAMYGALYLILMAGLGQFVRTVFASTRSQTRAHELERRLELAGIAQEVHDSGTSRLASILLLAQGIRARGDLPERADADLELLIASATSAAVDLSRAASPARVGDDAGPSGTFAEEWDRSLAVLRAAGFRVEGGGPAPPLAPGSVNAAAARIVIESTANICKHAAPGGKVEARAVLGAGFLVLEWSNETSTAESADSGGLGLSSMWARVEGLAGGVSASRKGAGFQLRVEIPVEGENE